jgi:hypothetical protein
MPRNLTRLSLHTLLGGLLLAACGDTSEGRLEPSAEEPLSTHEAALCYGLSVSSLTLHGISSYDCVVAGSGDWSVSTGANAVRLEYYLDGALHSYDERVGTSGTWNFSAGSALSCGTHTFLVKAYPMVIDSSGSRTTCIASPRSLSQTFPQNCPSQNSIGYGQMGYYNGCDYRDTCASGLVPHNVDPYNNNAKAAPGYFSCWYNTPDMNCYSKPKINGYINVRVCHTRPDGTKIDYGCGCP